MVRIIIFLIRKHLGLKKDERFQFSNQTSSMNRYYFTDKCLMKECFVKGRFYERPANVKLNYILSDKCEIRKSENLNWC